MTPKQCIAEAPSNIALIKYWGKQDHEKQWPSNDSVSMTLTNCRTVTNVRTNDLEKNRVWFAGERLEGSSSKLKRINRHLEFLKSELRTQVGLDVHTDNSFPMGAGIASSASGFAALTTATVGALKGADSIEDLNLTGHSLQKLSSLARMGSGSACRSLHPGFVHWCKADRAEEQYVRVIEESSPWELVDIILIVDPHEKKISSTQGHKLAFGSPLFRIRQSVIDERVRLLKEAIRVQDIANLGQIAESEAIEMHSIMMTSEESVFYMTEMTQDILQFIRRARSSTGIEMYFTLDAGPNVHVICQKSHSERAYETLQAEFKGVDMIVDTIGAGIRVGKDVNPI